MRRTSTTPPSGPAAVLGAAALWGTVGPAQVLAAAPIGPVALGALRLVLGGLVLVAGLAALRGASPFQDLRRRAVWPSVLAATVATAAFQGAFLASVDRVGAALATAVALGVAPVATGLCAAVALGERPGRAWGVATVLAVVGCVVLLQPWSSGGGIGGAGIALGVLGGGCYGVYTVAAKRTSDLAADATGPAAATLLLGGLLLLPAVAIDPHGLGAARSLALVAWLAIGTTAVAYALFVAGLRTTTAATVGTLSLAEPLVAVALGVVVLGEDLGAAETIGGLLMLAGLAAVALGAGGRRRRTAGTAAAVGPAPVG